MVDAKEWCGRSGTHLDMRFFALYTTVGVTRARPDARRHSYMIVRNVVPAARVIWRWPVLECREFMENYEA